MKIMVTLATLLTLYAGICAIVYFAQDRLLFFPRATDPHAGAELEVFHRLLESPAGVLSGWVIPAPDPEAAPLVFYFGGNAEDVSTTAVMMREKLSANLVFVNYRGYGMSAGAPSQQALFEDALWIHDQLRSTLPFNGNVVAFGRSLGSGVSVHLAAHRDIDLVVLVTPYDSIGAVAQRHYSWLPVRLLLKHPFDSISLAADLRTPALFVVAGRDTVIPPAHARKLADRWGGGVRWVRVIDATHNTIGNSADAAYWSGVRDFLGAVTP